MQLIYNEEEINRIADSSEERNIYINIFGSIVYSIIDGYNIWSLLNEEWRSVTNSTLLFRDLMVDISRDCSNMAGRYHCLNNNFEIPIDICKHFQKKEEELFIKYCVGRKYTIELIRSLSNAGFNFVLVNNSPYSLDIVKRILDNLNINGIEVVNELDKNPIAILKPHDRLISQINNSNVSCRNIDIACGNLCDYELVKKSPGYSALLRIAASKLFDNPYVEWRNGSVIDNNPYYLGYYLLGMHLIGVTKWIIRQAKKKGSDRIHFAARDGWLAIQAYRIFESVMHDLPEANYIQASRRMLIPINIASRNDFYQLVGNFSDNSPETIISVLWNISIFAYRGITYNESYISEEIKSIESLGYEYKAHFDSFVHYKEFIDYFYKHFYSSDNHNAVVSMIKDYYKDIEDGDIIFDVGNSGKIPYMVNRACGKRLNVLYLISDEECHEQLERVGNLDIETFYAHSSATDDVLRELLISENAPSTIGLTEENGKIIPVYDNNRDVRYESATLNTIQQGALDYVRDVIDILGEDIMSIPFKEQEVSLPFEGFLRYIPEADRELFTDIPFEEYYINNSRVITWKDRIDSWVKMQPSVGIIGENSELKNQLERFTVSRKRLAFWGCGVIAKSLLAGKAGIAPEVVFCNSSEELYIMGIPIVIPQDSDDVKGFFILIATKYYAEIEKQLLSYGMEKGKDFISYSELIGE